jgi:hypothetical protein
VVNVLRGPELFLSETGLRTCEPESVYMRLTLCQRVGEVTKTGGENPAYVRFVPKRRASLK